MTQTLDRGSFQLLTLQDNLQQKMGNLCSATNLSDMPSYAWFCDIKEHFSQDEAHYFVAQIFCTLGIIHN